MSESAQQENQPAATSQAGGARRGNVFIMAGVAAAVVLLVVGLGFLLYASAHESTDDAYVVAHVSNVGPRVSGTITNVLVDENEIVKAGEVLALIDARDYQVKADAAQAALEVAQQKAAAAKVSIPQAAYNAQAQAQQASGNVSGANSDIAESESKLAEAQADVLTARAAVKQADANLVRARQDYDRYKLLVQQGAISQQQFDDATAARHVNAAQRFSARAALTAAQTRVVTAQNAVQAAHANLTAQKGMVSTAQAGKVGVQLAQAQAQTAEVNVKQAQVSLDQANLNLSYCTITAPIAGRIGKRQVEVGQQVQPGQTIFGIVETSPWIEANFKETQLRKMRPGQLVDIAIDALDGKHFKGSIESISPASGSQFALLPPENATGNFTKIVQRIPVRIKFDAASVEGYEEKILAGMSTVVTVDLR